MSAGERLSELERMAAVGLHTSVPTISFKVFVKPHLELGQQINRYFPA